MKGIIMPPKINRENLQNVLRDKGTIHNRATVDKESAIDVDNRKISFIAVSDDNGGLRYDWWNDEIFEERLEPKGATFDGLNTFFKDHKMSVDTAIGRVENTRLDKGQIKTDVVFGTDDDSERIFNKFREGILTDVSIGYSINEVITTERENEPTEVLVTKFNIHELSAVWKGFDSNAKVGREYEKIIEKEETPNEKDLELQKQRLRRLDLAQK
jgi:hypothetical protein